MMTDVAEEFDVAVRSHRLHAQRFGSPSAPLVIGVHGLAGDMQQFDFLGEQLGGDDLQVVAVDLRGRGHSEPTGPGSYGWENHALDVLAVAGALGFQRFGLVGLSMGGSVAMKVAELDGSRLEAVALLDVAGRVDPGVGSVVDSVIDHLGQGHGSLADPAAVAEDRRYTLTQDPYARWKHLTMPTLLLRATQELAPGAGYVVPADDRDRFERDVSTGTVSEVDADHRTISTHPAAALAIAAFFATVAAD
jgi:pimeloyl-ACP methyl ester carboxylesterase